MPLLSCRLRESPRTALRVGTRPSTVSDEITLCRPGHAASDRVCTFTRPGLFGRAVLVGDCLRAGDEPGSPGDRSRRLAMIPSSRARAEGFRRRLGAADAGVFVLARRAVGASAFRRGRVCGVGHPVGWETTYAAGEVQLRSPAARYGWNDPSLSRRSSRGRLLVSSTPPNSRPAPKMIVNLPGLPVSRRRFGRVGPRGRSARRRMSSAALALPPTAARCAAPLRPRSRRPCFRSAR